MSATLSDYEKQREANIRERFKVLESLGLINVKANDAVQKLVPSKPSAKPLKRPRPSVAPEPTRRSNRLADRQDAATGDMNWENLVAKVEREAATEMPMRPAGSISFERHIAFLSDEQDSRDVSGYFNDQNKIHHEQPHPAKKRKFDKGSEFSCWDCSSLESLTSQITSLTFATPNEEAQGVKMIPRRGYSLAFVPTHGDGRVGIATGGLDGYLGVGVFQVSGGENAAVGSADSDLYCCWRPHAEPINAIVVPPPFGSSPDIYTCSYDGSVRKTNFDAGVFDEVYAVPNNEDICKFLCFHDPNTLMITQHQGTLVLVDLRAKKHAATYDAGEINCRTVSQHPTKNSYVAVCDKQFSRIFDLRMMRVGKTKKNKAIWEYRHGASVSSAFFSPLTGQKLLSSSHDDYIYIHDTSVLTADAIGSPNKLRHYNNTGRWLTRFRPTWHPQEHFFITGSLEQPRRTEVFAADDFSLVASLSGITAVTSITCFHPERTVAAGVSSSGRVQIWSA
jgi:WD40 repeat protein